ncbi:S-methyl-5-thioribose kinase [Candidatus Enterococcus ferrettii]|uniref:S-methyl-5-thioribose kinase n=1 Tax=Candidatus Enterococcus ferrettii TaxID=2815324 RepID=A0ABV0EKD7_9ENTE|nr:S-methyl-5-thioribose kinase [Enterococcus sp. 665A]MBO1341591.1 S-methyl-5-thioribose kinase [Enterococcus sp. 665A]
MQVRLAKNPRYQKHFLMDQAAIADYVVNELQLFPSIEELSVAEIGDGNINYVFRIMNQRTGESVVIKQADKLLRSSGRPLSIDRSRIEAEILLWQNELAPDYVPKVYHFDPQMYALTMEDISTYHNMRYQLIDQQVFPHFSEEISDYLAETLLPTTDLILARDVKKQKVRDFINSEMSDISEDLVFTEPYNNYKQRNIITPGNQEFVAENLYQNAPLQTEVAWLRNNFMNNAQALIHGDLHTGSIFINQTGLKVIDPEFAFYGPIGYDIGNVLAHLYFPMVENMLKKQSNQAFDQWSQSAIQEVYDKTRAKFEAIYDQQVDCSLYRNEAFEQSMLDAIFADALGYAGTEIIRRVVGDSKVKELSLLTQTEAQLKMERLLIKIGIQLIIDRRKITSGQQLIQHVNELKER